jgi:hypothetical protein
LRGLRGLPRRLRGLRELRGMWLYVLYPISTTSLDVEDAVCLSICIVNIEEKHQMRDSSGISSDTDALFSVLLGFIYVHVDGM